MAQKRLGNPGREDTARQMNEVNMGGGGGGGGGDIAVFLGSV